MMKKAEIKSQYEYYCCEAAEAVYNDVTMWENRHDTFQGAYALGWVLGIADIDTDEEISDAINFLAMVERINKETGIGGKASFGKTKEVKVTE